MNIPIRIIRFLKRYDIPQILIGLKILLAILLIGCLFNVSRDYYRIVRYFVFIMSIWIAYVEFNKGSYIAGTASIFTVIMLNPIVPLYIPQHQWLFFYASLAVALIGWVVYEIYVMETVSKSKDLRYRRQ